MRPNILVYFPDEIYFELGMANFSFGFSRNYSWTCDMDPGWMSENFLATIRFIVMGTGVLSMALD